MKPYPAYKDSGIEWIGKIPEHWDIVRMNHVSLVLDPQPDHRAPALAGDGEGFPYIGIRDINPDGTLNVETARQIEEKALIKQEQSFKVEYGDIVFCKVGTLGYPRHIKPLGRFALSATLVLIKIKENINSKFLRYALDGNSTYVQNDLLATGSTRRALGIEQIRRIFLCFPPLYEQQSIDTYLDYKTSQIDTLIEKKQKQIELLKEERTAIINQAVTKGLNPDVPMKDSGIEWMGEVPQHWDVTFLKHICAKITDGSHFSPETQDSGVPYITVQDVKDNFIDFENSKRISEIDYLNLKRNGCQPMEGDVLLTKDGTIGRAVVVESEEKFAILSSLGLIRPSKVKVIPDYLRYYLISGLNIDQMFSFIRGSALTRLTIKLIEQLIIVYPSIQEQQSIVVHLNQKTFQIDNIIKNIQKQLILLQEYRTALISNAVTGKIDIRDYHGNSTESNM